ncbi:beta-glucosidase family protein [Promicromonospora sp. Marseille-Q5078]
MTTSRSQGSLRAAAVGIMCVAGLLLPLGASAAVGNSVGASTSGERQQSRSTHGQSWWDDSRSATRRAQALLEQMTLEEKVDMLHGELNNSYGFYNAPIERLGIPALTMADGPAGVRIANPDVNDQQSTQLPSPIALAATWNADTAEEYGLRAGDEAFRSGHNMLLAPAMDIARVPLAGRAFEAFGEDPLISGTFGGAISRGIQENSVIADIKHYNVYTQEKNRLLGGNAVMDERTLQEIYTRPFDIAYDEGHAGSAMCSFNKVNGGYACENDVLLNQILKTQLEFEGWVMSDYGATQSTETAIEAGLDQEMPGDFGAADCFFCTPLLDAVNAGQVPVSRIDDAVLRILRPMFGLGLFDDPPTVQPLPEEENGAFAREVSEQATVLLKNDDAALPLGDDVGSVAVIGTDADHAVQGGGSSQVLPTYTVSPLEGITDRAAGATVTHVPGTDPVTSTALLAGPDPIPSDVLTSAGDGEPGLRVEYFANPDLSGAPALDRTEPYAGINGGFYFNQGLNSASPHFPTQTNDNTSSIRWTGTLTAPVDGTYELSVTSNGTSTLYLDDDPVITTEPTEDPLSANVSTAEVTLEAGTEYDVRAEFAIGASGTDSGAAFKLGWVPPEGYVQQGITDAAEAAADADVAVVVVRDYSTEGGDKPALDLPNGQAELIRQVAAANPRTVVVLTAGAAVQTSDWEDDVAAVLHNWFGGQEQGNAIARILFGDVNPSGKLPVTIPVDEESTPVSSPEQYPGDGLDQHFTEGILVGYRGYDALGIEPAYAFGHGLSYTTFDYSRLRTDVDDHGRNDTKGDRKGDSKGKQIEVTVRVRNTGDVTGTETVQAYVGELPTTRVDTAPLALAGWEQVTLRPGQRKTVTITLDPRSLSYWDVDRDRWVTPRGEVTVSIGSASDDLRLDRDVRVGDQRGGWGGRR